MENTLGTNSFNQKELVISNNGLVTSDPINKIPTLENLLSKSQEPNSNSSETLKWRTLEDQEFQKEIENLPTLLQKDKAKAQRLIGHLVTSAKEIKQTITNSLTSVPVHPYERLIYEYLGSDFVPNSIQDYTVPEQFNPIVCLKELEKISRKTSQIEMTHYASISAEALKPGFNGTFDVENLNNVFAVPTTDAKGKQTFAINKKRLAEHLKFVEMAKRIPAEYIVRNPLSVAKILIAEFIRIHKVEETDFDEELVSNNIAQNLSDLKDLMKTPTSESLKQIFNQYKQLNGSSTEYDELFTSLIEASKQKELHMVKNQIM